MNGLDIFYCILLVWYGFAGTKGIIEGIKYKHTEFIASSMRWVGSFVGTLAAWLFLLPLSWTIGIILFIVMIVTGILNQVVLDKYIVGRFIVAAISSYVIMYIVSHVFMIF